MNKQRNIISIGVLAERFGVSAESLRIWERQGLIPPSYRTPGGHRRYGPEHIRALDAVLGRSQPHTLQHTRSSFPGF